MRAYIYSPKNNLLESHEQKKGKIMFESMFLGSIKKKNGGYGSKTTRPQNNPEVDGFTAETF